MCFATKAIIVTGSSSGIGRATALLFARQGANVLIHGRARETLEQTVDECKQVGARNAIFPIVQGDVKEPGLLKKIFETAVEKFGKINILINNVGCMKPNLLLDVTEESFDWHINTNLKPAIFLSQMCFPELKKSQGNIVNVSSIGGARPIFTGGVIYGIAKAGLNHFTQCAGMEYGSQGVRINAVCPALVETPFMVKYGFVQSKEEESAAYEYFTKSLPIKKRITAEETAKLIAYLASDDASMMNGQCIIQDGGLSLIGNDMITFEKYNK